MYIHGATLCGPFLTRPYLVGTTEEEIRAPMDQARIARLKVEVDRAAHSLLFRLHEGNA